MTAKPASTSSVRSPLARFDNDLSAAKPDLILLMEGANDLNDTTDMVNAAITDIVSTLEEMVKGAGRRQIPIMVGTLPPQRPPRTAAPNIGRFNDAVRVMAAKKGGILVDVNARIPPLTLIGQDGLHPTEEGYQRIAEILSWTLLRRCTLCTGGDAAIAPLSFRYCRPAVFAKKPAPTSLPSLTRPLGRRLMEPGDTRCSHDPDLAASARVAGVETDRAPGSRGPGTRAVLPAVFRRGCTDRTPPPGSFRARRS